MLWASVDLHNDTTLEKERERELEIGIKQSLGIGKDKIEVHEPQSIDPLEIKE